MNTDEFGLYQIDLPSTTVTKLTPLLSLVVQRKIVNEEGTRAFDTLRAVTREDGLAWSPMGDTWLYRRFERHLERFSIFGMRPLAALNG